MSVANNARYSFMIPEPERELSFISRPPSPFREPTKYLERRLIRAWKSMTRVARKQQRNSVLPDGFVMMNARRKSVMLSMSKRQ